MEISRIIFPRKMRPKDMAVVAQACAKRSPGLENMKYEAFALNELCQFSGAFCNSLHCDEMGYLCRVPYRVGVGKSQRKDSILIDHKEWDGTASSREYTSEARQCGGTWDSPESDFDAPILGESGCGLCALYDLGQAGITLSENCRQRKPPGPDGGRHPGDEACVGDPGCLQRPGNLSKTDEAGVVFERLQQKLLLSTSKFIKFAKNTCILGKSIV